MALRSLRPLTSRPSLSFVATRMLSAILCCAALGLAGGSALAQAAKAGAKTSAKADVETNIKTPSSAPSSASLDVMDAFNNASDSPLLKSGSKGAAVARAQILMDRGRKIPYQHRLPQGAQQGPQG